MKIYIPGDSAAQSVGSDLVAVALAAEAAKRNLEITIIRNGTRGALWLEPLVEIEKDGKRIGYNNVTSDDAAAVLDGTHPSIGDVDSYEWFTKQDRVTYKRVGIIDPLSISDYEALSDQVQFRFHPFYLQQKADGTLALLKARSYQVRMS